MIGLYQMNYQFCWYLFQKPLTFFSALLFCSFTLTGITASSTYLLVFGIIFPVAISMWLHLLSENNRALPHVKTTEYIVYLPAIPVQEEQSALHNVAFPTKYALHRFYRNALYCKLILHILMFVILYIDVRNMKMGGLWIPAALLTAGVLLNGLLSTMKSLLKVIRHQYIMHEEQGIHVWYEAHFGKRTGLSELFSVK